MSPIHITTFVKAPVDRVFDLCRNTTIYKKTLNKDKESITASASDILLKQGDTVTFSAKHLGKLRTFTARIVEMLSNEKFVEEQVKGDLKSFRHEHHFKPVENGTIVIDVIALEEPRDIVGSVLGKYFMKKYFERIVNSRNAVMKQYAESEKWHTIMG